MSNTYKLIELAKKENGIESDYGIAKLIGVTSQKLSNWKTGHSEANAVNTLKLMKAANISIDDALKLMTERPANPSGALLEAAENLYIMLNCTYIKIKAKLFRLAHKHGFRSICIYLLQTH